MMTFYNCPLSATALPPPLPLPLLLRCLQVWFTVVDYNVDIKACGCLWFIISCLCREFDFRVVDRVPPKAGIVVNMKVSIICTTCTTFAPFDVNSITSFRSLFVCARSLLLPMLDFWVCSEAVEAAAVVVATPMVA